MSTPDQEILPPRESEPLVLPHKGMQRSEVEGFLYGVAWILAENGVPRERISKIIHGPAVQKAKELWPDFDMTTVSKQKRDGP